MRFLDTLNLKPRQNTPIWIMRQAGRYLSEYRTVRETTPDFISFCLNPEKACEVTLQPIRKFGFDASIIFSDILLILSGLGRDLTFKKGEGPVLTPLQSFDELKSVKPDIMQTYAKPVADAIKLTRSKLPSNVALIGFSGAPWTLMTYLLEGGSSRDFALVRQFLYSEPKQTDALLSLLSDAVTEFLVIQAQAGANVLMLFDSWSGMVPSSKRDSFVTTQHQKIIQSVRDRGCYQPFIAFPKGLSEGLVSYCDNVDISCVGVDHLTDLSWVAQSVRSDIALQGNLDPLSLVAGGEQMKIEVDFIMEAVNGRHHIFNLGHGIVPQTPPHHVSELIELVRFYG